MLFRGGEGVVGTTGAVEVAQARIPEGAAEGKAIRCGSHYEAMLRFPLDLGGYTGPGDDHGVGVVIQAAFEMEEVWTGLLPVGAVLLRVRPIGGVHGARCVGELEDHRDAASHANSERVLIGMAAGLHRDLLPAPFELAVQRAGPQVERLLEESDVFGLVDGEADAAQVKAVRILAQPIEERLLSVARCGVAHFAAIGVEFGEPQIGRPFARGVRRGVPAPLRLRAEGHPAFIRLRKRL